MRKLALALCLSLAAVPATEAAAKKPGKGPKPSMVKKTFSGHYDAVYTESWMTEDQVKVKVSRLKVLKAQKKKVGAGRFDPKVWQWPVRADIHIKICRDPALECEAKRVGWWAKDVLGGRTLFWWLRNVADKNRWKWETSSESW